MTEPTPITKAKPKKAKLSQVEKLDLDALLNRMNEEYAVIMRGSNVLIMRHWIKQDGKSELVFFSKRDFLLWQENNKLWVDDGKGGTKAIKIAVAWLEWAKRAAFEEVYFEPQGKEYSLRYNLWRGFAFNPDTSGKTDKILLFLNHIKRNICQNNEEYYKWVMAWLADMFQRPSRKLGTALVLRGEMGVGKGQFAYHVGKLLGLHYIPITQASHLTGKFNGHIADKILMFVDEGFWSDERNGAGTLRALITEPQMTIELKGKDAVTIDNFTRLIIAANNDWVVPVGMGDERRFMMLDVGKENQRDKDFFEEMQQQMDAGGYKQLLNYLQTYEYEEETPRKIIQTEALTENKIFSMPDEMKWWHECLMEGKIKGKDSNFQLLNDVFGNEIETDKFYDNYLFYCDKQKIRPKAYNILPKLMKKYVQFNKKESVNTDGSRGYFYNLSNLDKIRGDFSTVLGKNIDWSDI